MTNRTVISLDLAKRVIQVAKFTQDAVIQFNKAMSPEATRKVHPCLFSKSIPALRPTFLLKSKKAAATKILNRTKRLSLGTFLAN